MQIKEKNVCVKKKVKDFDLDHIFDCGQSFRWSKEEDGSYTGIAFGKVVNMSLEKREAQENETYDILTIDNCTEDDFENIWCDYLDLERDYGKIKISLGEKDETIKEAITYGEGIRILNQEKWETLISFIISQNNNIPRIKKCIENLSVLFGEKAGEYRGNTYYSLPSPKRLAAMKEEDLAPIRLGYRARYLIETAKSVMEDDGRMLAATEEMSTEEAYKYLTKLCGVGPKVANCILLFSMKKYESFPIDVWVKRVMNRLYDIDEGDMKAMALFAKDKFGNYGGIAQQYLFYYIRMIS